MNNQELTRQLILEWAYQDVDIDMYDSGDDVDAACFDLAVNEFFDVNDFLLFSVDPDCLARIYLLKKLTDGIVRAIARSSDFSYDFPGVFGVISESDYLEGVLRRGKEDYALLTVLNKMRAVEDDTVRLLYHEILEVRKNFIRWQVSS